MKAIFKIADVCKYTLKEHPYGSRETQVFHIRISFNLQKAKEITNFSLKAAVHVRLGIIRTVAERMHSVAFKIDVSRQCQVTCAKTRLSLMAGAGGVC